MPLEEKNGKNETKRNANKSWEWKHILKPIYDEKGVYTGNGITPSVPTIILPCNPMGLVERLDILMANKAPRSTRVRNELVSVAMNCKDRT